MVADIPANLKKLFFGKGMEHFIFGAMLRQGIDVYSPLVDGMGIDAIIRKKDGSFIAVQIKSLSSYSNPANFSAKCEHDKDYWFIFYSEKIGEKGTTWLMTSEEFRKHANKNKKGKNIGQWNLCFTRTEKGKAYLNPEYDKYICHDFDFKRLMDI